MRSAARVVVAGGVHDLNAGVREHAELFEQEALGGKRRAGAVEEVSGDQHRVDFLGDREGHAPGEGVTRYLPEPVPHVFRAAGEGGVEMNVRDVDEAHRAVGAGWNGSGG